MINFLYYNVLFKKKMQFVSQWRFLRILTFNQHLCYFHMSVLYRHHQWRSALIVGHVDIPTMQQHSDEHWIATRCRCVQRDASWLVDGVTGTSVTQEELGCLHGLGGLASWKDIDISMS